jgi:hypothetical protein
MLNVKKQLYDDIVLYCKTNNISDIELFCNELLEKGFNIEKYGTAPSFVTTVEKIVEKKVEPIVSEPEITVSLPPQPEITKDDNRKNYKKANLNDDYRVYDN